MKRKGCSYIATLNQASLEWGTHRYTNSRGKVYGEGYIPIPTMEAQRLGLYNQNRTKGKDILGENLFNCMSVDGFFSGVLRSQGCNQAGDIYAKQFSADKDLKAIGQWFSKIDASIDDKVEVLFTSETDIMIRKL